MKSYRLAYQPNSSKTDFSYTAAISRLIHSSWPLFLLLVCLSSMRVAHAASEPVITQVTVGDSHTCALTREGAVKCWGINGAGQLGDGSMTNRSTPVDVSGLASGVSAIAAGEAHTCALTRNGEVKCWGFNAHGELADASLTNRTTPVDVGGLAGVSAITAGNDHTCALVSGGGVKCWGRNDAGQLGDASLTANRTAPVDVIGLGSGVTAITAGGEYTCALTSSGAVKCWGFNGFGQLGDGSLTTRTTPVDVSGLGSGVTAIAAGGVHTCALTSSGAVKCWGNNVFGQLGNADLISNRTTPFDVDGLGSGISAIVAGSHHTCALTIGGAAKCWGRNANGQLGDTSKMDRSTPADVSGLGSNVSAIAAGGAYTCALTSDGAAKCWGNKEGPLGSSSTDSTTPEDVNFQSSDGGGGGGCTINRNAGFDWGFMLLMLTFAGVRVSRRFGKSG